MAISSVMRERWVFAPYGIIPRLAFHSCAERRKERVIGRPTAGALDAGEKLHLPCPAAAEVSWIRRSPCFMCGATEGTPKEARKLQRRPNG
jgi:hypothetical protein